MVIINLMFDWFCPCSVDLTILRDFCRCETWFAWFTSPCLVQNTANNDMGLAETCSNASCKIGWLWVLSRPSLCWLIGNPHFSIPVSCACTYCGWSMVLSPELAALSQFLVNVPNVAGGIDLWHSPYWYRILARCRFYPYVVHVLLIFLHQFSVNLTIKSMKCVVHVLIGAWK